MTFVQMSEGHLPLVGAFFCVESDAELAPLKSRERRRIKQHSLDMQKFLRNEAFHDQELGLNRTFLLMDDDQTQIIAYLSLCNDAINLEIQERKDEGVIYGSAPSLKIARLAVDAHFTHQGIGKQLIQYAAYQASLIREHSGVFFLTLDCYQHRLSFYESVGFVKNLIQPVQLPYDSPISMRIGLDSYLASLTTDK